MSIRRRIERLEEEAKRLRLDEDLCRRCKAPVPSMPPQVMLFPTRIQFGGRPCPDCGGVGGARALAIDNEGAPIGGVPRLMCVAAVPDDEVQPWKKDYVGRWLELNGERSFGQPWDRWLRWVRRTRESRQNTSDSQ